MVRAIAKKAYLLGRVAWLRLRKIGAWLGQARYAFLCAAIIAVAVLVTALWPTDFAMRAAGLMLQLLGLGTVVVGVDKTRRLFGRAGIAQAIIAWFKAFPSFSTRLVLEAGSLKLGLGMMRPYAQVWTNPKDDSFEAKMAALETNVRRVADELSRVEQRIDQESDVRAAALKAERAAWEKGDHQTREKLELSATGGLQLSLVGVFWIAVGLAMSTLPGEILGLLD